MTRLLVPDPPEPRDPPLRREPTWDDIEETLVALFQYWRDRGTKVSRKRFPEFLGVFDHFDAAADEVNTELPRMLTEDWPA